jgi:hypothetical protein
MSMASWMTWAVPGQFAVGVDGERAGGRQYGEGQRVVALGVGGPFKGRALRISVDELDVDASTVGGGRQVDRAGGLGHPTLGVHQRQNRHKSQMYVAAQ